MPEQLSLSFSPGNSAAVHIQEARKILENGGQKTNDDPWEQDLEDYYAERAAQEYTGEYSNMAEWLLRQDGCGGNNNRYARIKPYPPISPDRWGEIIARRRKGTQAGIEACRRTLWDSRFPEEPDWQKIGDDTLAQHAADNAAA